MFILWGKTCVIIWRLFLKNEIQLLDISSSFAQSCPTLHDLTDCSTPGFPAITNSWSLFKFMSVESVMPSTISSSVVSFSSCPQSFPASGSFLKSQFFAPGGKYWSFSFSMSPSKEYSGLISFRTDWSDLLAVQGTLKSLLQHHNSKASILQRSAFFMVQLSHSYMTPGKTITLTIQTFVCKVMSLCFLLCCLGLS